MYELLKWVSSINLESISVSKNFSQISREKSNGKRFERNFRKYIKIFNNVNLFSIKINYKVKPFVLVIIVEWWNFIFP